MAKDDHEQAPRSRAEALTAGSGVRVVIPKAKMQGAPGMGASGASDGGALVAFNKKKRKKKAAKAAKFSGVPGQASTGMGDGGQLTPEMAGWMKTATPSQVKAAMKFEQERGSGTLESKRDKVANHLAERPEYYEELDDMLRVPMAKADGGPYRGPRGGLYSDPERTKPIRNRKGSKAPKAEAKPAEPDEKSKDEAPKGELPDEKKIDEQGQKVVDHVAEDNPELAEEMKATLDKLKTAIGKKRSSGQARKPDDVVTDQTKAFGRAFNQAAAPASILGPELGGLLSEVGKEGQRDAAKDAQRYAQSQRLVAPLSKSGPYGFPGQRGNWRAMPLVAPIAGSAPREDTPALPDFQDIYYQPKSSEHRKREAAQVTTRRLSDAKRVSGIFGFHGAGDVPLQPILHYVRPGTTKSPRREAERFTVEDMERRDAGKSKTIGEPKQTDAGRVSRSPDRRDDLLADVYGRPIPTVKDDDADEDDKKKKKRAQKSGLLTFEEILEKAKYVRREPYTDAKGRRRYRYYYRDSAVARDVKAGTELRLGKQSVTVDKVDDDGTVHLKFADGSSHRVPSDDWGGFMTRYFGHRYQEWASKRAQQSVNAVLRLVPRSLLGELEGDTDEARLKDLQKRAPKLYERLSKSFQRAGVSPFKAKRVISRTLESRGWAPEARAAVIGSVLTRRTGPDRVQEVVRAAENLAGGGKVTQAHVGGVIELSGGLGPSVDVGRRIETVAKKAEAEIGQLVEAIETARSGGQHEKAEAYAKILSSSGLQKLLMLAQAFPGLTDRAVQPAREVAMEVPSLAPHPKPKTHGAEASLYVAGEGGAPKALKARYRLMEAGDVRASHDATKGFRRRDDYPEGVQERAYHRDKAEQAKVIRNAQKLNPAFVVNTNPDAVNGPPMVTPDGVTLGGNSRAMSMQKAYADHPEKAEAMRQYLSDHAHEFGLSPSDVAAMKSPMLVREVSPDEGEKHSKDEMRLLVRQMNESFTQGMDPRTMQVAMGRKLDETSLKQLADGMQEDETLSSFLTSSRSEPFINSLMRNGIIDQRNANQYFKKGTKTLNEDGKQLVERILVGRVVGDADTLSNTRAKTASSIARAVPFMVQAKAYGQGYDVGDDLAVAVSALNDLNSKVEAGVEPALDSKMSERRFNSLFNHFESLFGDKHPVVDNPRARQLLEVLIRRPGPVQMSNVFRDYVKRASQNPEGQASMFGPAPSPAEVLTDTVRAALGSASG